MNVAPKLAPVTLAEFETIERDEHFNYELIDGVVMMSPSPSREHQGIGFKIIGNLFNLIDPKTCSGYYESDIQIGDDVFRPDISIFCHEQKEIPVIVFEILSLSTKRVDMTIKTIKYEEAGIKEYWIIDPKVKIVTVHDYNNQTTETYGLGETIQSQARPEIIITVADIFA